MNIVFFGSPIYSSRVLSYLLSSKHSVKAVVTQDIKKDNKKRVLKTPVGIFSEENKLHTLYPINLDSSDFIAELRSLNADIFLIYAYGKILPADIINIPKFGVINLHCSLLPRWRGAAPIQRALLNRDSMTGITFFKINEHLDTGNILASYEYLIKEEDDSLSLQEKLTDLAIENIENILESNLNDKILTPQNNSLATYATKLSKDESIINWNEDAEIIIAKVKAFAGWPGVQAELFDVKFKIHQAKCINDSNKYSPGSVMNFNHDKFEIKAKKGIIQINKLQLPGKNIITNKDLYNSNSQFSTKIKSYSVK
ncbi:MAG: methionyl-tRNA formyltransferase [Gammaproteobacteria bacterium]